MKQVVAEVISSKQILEGLKRRRDLQRPKPRDISGSWLIWLKSPEIAQEARPGQFVMVKCGDDTLLRRPFSIHRINNDSIALFFALLEGGKGTGWLSHCQKGNTVELLGPLGNGFSINPASSKLLLTAGGIGIAPLVFLAQTALEQGHSVTLLLGAATGAQLYPSHLLPPGVKCITATEDGTEGKKGIVTELVPEHVDWADQIIACGPIPMYRAMAKMPELKDKPCQISLEVRMGCGFGVCYGCTIKTKQGLKQVCRDGPIFSLRDVLWDELVDI